MKIEYLGHSCFKLTESTGTTIITDPYSDKIGYKLPKMTADIITSSHNHYDHNHFEGISGNPKIITDVNLIEEKGVTISGVKTYHDEKKGIRRGTNIVYKYRMDGVDICHLGDICHECSSSLLEVLLPVNVLMIPVGGKYTLDADMAYDYVEKLMPDIVIPMHYKTRSLTIDIDKVKPFLEKFEEEQIEVLEDSSINVDRDALDEKETKIIVLSRKKG